MIRKDREITNINEIAEIIEKCQVCSIAILDGSVPYVIPLSFGGLINEDKIILYFHCALNGKKIDLISKNNNAAFEMHCSEKLLKGKAECDYTMKYESVCGKGIIEPVSEQEKLIGLTVLMEHYNKNSDHCFKPEQLKRVNVLKLTVTEYTGKKNI